MLATAPCQAPEGPEERPLWFKLALIRMLKIRACREECPVRKHSKHEAGREDWEAPG